MLNLLSNDFIFELNMSKIDVKDRKILYELDVNARQSFSKIAKKVGLSKSSVSYRINRLENEGVIQNYYTFIDGIRLGYVILRLYIIYQYTTKEIENEIIEYFLKNKATVAIYSIDGRYDLEIIFWIKDINQFYNIWNDTLKRYSDFFQDQVLSFYIKYITFKNSYLIYETKNNFHNQNVDMMGGGEQVKIDETDYNILKIISSNARMPLSEIAKKIKINPDTICYRLNKLKKNRIIQGFRVNIDYSKLGYQYFKTDIYLKDYIQRKKIINFIKTNPHLISINETTGVSHLELELHLKSLLHLNEVMNEIQTRFPLAVRNYKYFNFQKIHKYTFFPEDY